MVYMDEWEYLLMLEKEKERKTRIQEEADEIDQYDVVDLHG